MKKTLYQLDTKNKVRVWKIEVIDNGTSAEIVMTKGLEDGKHTVDKQTIKEGKNAGKANATTYYSQAVADAQSKIDSKIREGYVEDKSQIKASNLLGSGVPAPMLAQKYDPTEKQSSSKNLKRAGIEGKKVMVQRKKDGNRCNIHVNRTSARPFTRKGDPLPTNGIEHILAPILAAFQKSADYYEKNFGITEYVLDGELFTKAFSFNKLNGLVKKEKKSADELKDCKEVVYHLYDVMLPVGYETRYKVIQNFAAPAVHVEEAIEIVATEANIQEWLEKFLAEGEEGLMIRVLGMPYEHKRSWSLMKVKNFEDAEFRVIGFEESARAGMAGAVVVAMTAPSKDRDGNPILTFKAGLNMSHEECKEMWENQSKYIGQLVTVEFFGRSEYNVPRFPKAKGFRNDA